ncbi:MAG TPA: hypothetical protein VF472_07140 [Burkholderiaceae bacterium]
MRTMKFIASNKSIILATVAIVIFFLFLLSQNGFFSQSYKITPNQKFDYLNYEKIQSETVKVAVIIERTGVKHLVRIAESTFRENPCNHSSTRTEDIERALSILQESNIKEQKRLDRDWEIKEELVFFKRDGGESHFTFEGTKSTNNTIRGEFNGIPIQANQSVAQEIISFARGLKHFDSCLYEN